HGQQPAPGRPALQRRPGEPRAPRRRHRGDRPAPCRGVLPTHLPDPRLLPAAGDLGRDRRPGQHPRGPGARETSTPGANWRGGVINLKTKHEIELMATAGRLLSSVVDEMKAACEPGVTTGDLDRLAERQIRKGGGRPGFLGYQ